MIHGLLGTFMYRKVPFNWKFNPYINNNTDRTLDVVFTRFRGFSFTITLGRSPKEFRAGSVELLDRIREPALPTQNSFGPLSQGYCERKTHEY